MTSDFSWNMLHFFDPAGFFANFIGQDGGGTSKDPSGSQAATGRFAGFGPRDRTFGRTEAVT